MRTSEQSSKRLLYSKQRQSEAKKNSSASPRRLRGQAEPESGGSSDSTDSLMNELKSSAKKSQYDTVTDNDSTEEQSESVTGSVGRGRHRAQMPRAKRPSAAKIARQKNLGILRKRRAGEVVASSEDDLEITNQDDNIDPDTVRLNELDETSNAEHSHGRDVPDLDEYEKDFVEDDEVLGVPLDHEELPLEFSRHAHKKQSEYFKDVVEWMIHNKLNPAFARDDELYSIAKRKVDDTAQGFAGSKFISTAWKVEFAKALRTYPDIARTDVPTMFDQSCEACGRSNHPAKHQIIFSGRPYHRESLEDISSDEDNNEDKTPKPYSKPFLLGRTCNANAETAHALYHWRHQLNQVILERLRDEGHTTPEKIVEREGWSVKRRAKYANKVVDEMEEEGAMRELYKEFKENLEAARNAKNEITTTIALVQGSGVNFGEPSGYYIQALRPIRVTR
ncbi:MAG: hypothetical protein Q9219_005829 [cf. Caloplaca sp. 3 TL-2023]